MHNQPARAAGKNPDCIGPTRWALARPITRWPLARPHHPLAPGLADDPEAP
jgi:hypothetical protein